MRVLVTRPASEAHVWVDELRRRGFDAAALALIAIAPSPRPELLADAWGKLDGHRAVMFVSGNAVRYFFAQQPAAAVWPLATRAWATGNGTRQALMEMGLAPAQIDAPPMQSPQFDSETLWEQVESQVKAGDRVLLVRGADAGREGEVGRDWLASRLQAAGARVTTVLAYVRQVPLFDETQRMDAAHCASEGAWLFSSSQAIANLQSLLPGQGWGGARAVATHPRIARAARAAGFGVVCESRPSLDAVAAALESIR